MPRPATNPGPIATRPNTFKPSLAAIDNALRAPNGWDEAKLKPAKFLFGSSFTLGEKVTIDNHADLVGVVTAVMWRDTQGCSAEVSWVHNGTLHTEWLHPSRLKLA